MASFRHLITVPISGLAFITTFLVVGKLMWFLSMPTKTPREYVWLLNMLDDHSRLNTALLPITTDLILVILFVLQHSLMRSAFFSRLWSLLGLETIERSIYNLSTSLTLWVSCINQFENIYFVTLNFKCFAVLVAELENDPNIRFVGNRCSTKCSALVFVCGHSCDCLVGNIRWNVYDGFAGVVGNQTGTGILYL